MKSQCFASAPIIVLLALVLVMILVVASTAAQVPLAVAADFGAPMSAWEAQQRVVAAQQAEQKQRDEAAQMFNAIDPALLPMVETVFMLETKHHLSNRAGFLSFWRQHGGALIFGFPISEEIVEDGQIVQYFEQARFEYHPEYAVEASQVQLSLLGRELIKERQFTPAAAVEGARYFAQTGHNLAGKFLQFWVKRGGLPVFGYPLSEAFEEVSPVDGQIYLTQYFERARFEYHPEALDSFYHQMEQINGIQLVALHEIQLTDIGRQIAERKGYRFSDSQQLTGTLSWSPMNWDRHITVNLTTQQLTAYEGDTLVYRAPVATGKDGFNTPTGSFAIYSKYPLETMAGSANGESWYVPNIPWVQYIVGGVAFHGTYWHDQWGTGVRMSHGCINLNMDDAQWLYEWTDVGTQVDIYY